MMKIDRVDIIVKTRLGMERIAANRIKEILEDAEVNPRPNGLLGLITVKTENKFEAAEKIREKILEADRIILVDAQTKAEIKNIIEKAVKIAEKRIGRKESFAVRTVRRGRHNFTSVDVNVALGEAVRRRIEARVDLTNPDKIIRVEIIGETALIAIIPGGEERKKLTPEKKELSRYMGRIAIVQIPYLGSPQTARIMGVRIGREVQTFEVKEFVISPVGLVDGGELKNFIEGVFEGIDSRYKIQVKSYGRKVRRVPVYIQDLHQLVRDRYGREPIIIFEPEGEPIHRIKGKIVEKILEARRVNYLLGSREGVPLGLYRFADLVVDLCPGITISTDYAAASALIATATILEEKLAT